MLYSAKGYSKFTVAGSSRMEGNQGEVLSPLPIRKTSCPMCKGTGFYERPYTPSISTAGLSRSEIKLPRLRGRSPNPNTVRTKCTLMTSTRLGGSLPQLVPPSRRTKEEAERSIGDHTTSTCTKLPNLKGSLGSSGSTSNEDVARLLPPIAPSHPDHFLHKTVANLKSNNWETLRTGLEDAVRIVREEGNVGGAMISVVNRALLTALASPRSRVVRTALQAAAQLFSRMKVVCRPEFDDIVNTLLTKTADQSRAVREEAMEALLAVVDHIPTKATVRALADKAPRHKNYLVRQAVATLMLNIVQSLGVEPLFHSPGYRDTRKRIMESMANLLNDPNTEVRGLTKKIFELFVNEPDFDEIFATDVDGATARKIERQLILLRYGHSGS